MQGSTEPRSYSKAFRHIPTVPLTSATTASLPSAALTRPAPRAGVALGARVGGSQPPGHIVLQLFPVSAPENRELVDQSVGLPQTTARCRNFRKFDERKSAPDSDGRFPKCYLCGPCICACFHTSQSLSKSMTLLTGVQAAQPPQAADPREAKRHRTPDPAP